MEVNKIKYHINTVLINTPLMLGPITVFQVSELAADSDLEILTHLQPCHEITKILSGNGIFSRNGENYDVGAGDLFVVKKGDMHYIRSSKANPLRFVCFAFNFNRENGEFASFEPISAFFEELTSPIAKDAYNIGEAVSIAQKEINSSAGFSREMTKYGLLQAIIGTYRSFNGSEKPISVASSRDINPLIYKITSYIDSHIESLDNLYQIAEEIGYSYGYLSKQFSSTMDMTIMEYYTGRRFSRAAELLKEGKSVSETAARLMFSDAQSFCKAFKRYYTVPPKKYIADNR